MYEVCKTWLKAHAPILLAIALVLLLAFLPSSCLAAEKTYQVTATELKTLKSNLSRLQTIIEESRKESELQKNQLTVLKSQLSEADSLLMKQKDSLATANKLLQQSIAEEKKAQRRLKRERTIWMSIVGAFILHHLAR